MKSRILALIYFLLSFQACAGTTVTAEKDGLVLEVTITSDDGKDLVSCRLTNNSEYPICTASIRYKQVFYVTLIDKNGNELPHNEEWADTYAQKSSRIYKRPRSHTGFQVNPGKSVDLTFYLSDAFPETSISQAHQMQVSWESKYFGAENDLDGNPYHFPAEWETSVSIPLAELGVVRSADKDNQASEATNLNDKPDAAISWLEASRKERTFYSLLVAGIVILVGLLLLVGFKKKSKSITRQ
jgi:hypothetical protein